MLPFVRRGTFLIGLGDPAGNAEDCVSAIWWLRDLAVQEGRQPAFWCVGAMFLPVYNDLGLTAWPLPVSAQKAHSPGMETFYLCARPNDARLLQSLMHN